MADQKNEKKTKTNQDETLKKTTDRDQILELQDQGDGNITDSVLNTTNETILDYEETTENETPKEEQGQEKPKEEGVVGGEQEIQGRINPKGRTKRQRDIKKENAKIKIELFEEINLSQNLRHKLEDLQDQLVTKNRVIKEMDKQLAVLHAVKDRNTETKPSNTI